MDDLDQRKFWSALSHVSILFSITILPVGLPIGIGLIFDDPIVKENAKEAINCHFNVWLYGALIAILTSLTFGLLGFILIPLGLLLHWGMTMIAVIYCLFNTDSAYRYPFIFRLL